MLTAPALNPAVVDRARQYSADHRLFERHATGRAASPWVGVRLDGRAFHTLTRDMQHPFDPAFGDAITAACEALMHDEIGFCCCYTQSDEITLILSPSARPFNRRVEKLLSVPASVCSAVFSMTLGRPAAFDARLLTLDDELAAIAAIAERQADCVRNAVTTLAFWTLRAQGRTAQQAERELRPLGMHDRMSLCEQLGAPFNDLPQQRRMGRLLHFERVPHTGHNPLTGEEVPTTRRELRWQPVTPDFRTLDALPGR